MQTSVTHVLVHGFAGTAASWRGVPLTGAVVALTMPGHGGGPVRSGGFDGFVDWLCSHVRGIASPHLVGYSAGGRVVLGALARGVSCVGATLVSTGFGAATPEERAARATADAAWSALLRQRGIEAFISAWEAQPLFASQHSAPDAALDAQRELRRTLAADALADAMDALSVARMPDLSATLATYPGRVQLVVGALDTKYVTLAHSVRMRRGDVIEIPGCGHNPLLEAPRALARVLEEFVARPA